MSAILARIHLSGRPVDPLAFANAFNTLSDYGPDGAATLVEDWCAVGHQNTAVAPEPENQPVVDGDTVLVADAILDDRGGLINQLGLSAEARDWPDSRLILAGIHRWGADCPAHLVGDFAFVAVDRANRTVIAARDPIGARPLYVHHADDKIVFASDLRAIAAFGDIDTGFDDEAIVTYLANPMVQKNRTFFRTINKLPPGTALLAKPGHVERTTYWRPDIVATVRYKKFETYAEHLHDLLTRAVGDRARTEKAVGAHISGGIDSSLVCAISQRHLRARGRSLKAAYAWAPPVSDDLPDLGEMDERRTIAAICEREELTCRWGTTTGRSYLEALRRPIEFEGPTGVIHELDVIDEAARDGVRVMLSGWGGDEAFSFSGAGYAAGLLHAGRLTALIRYVRRRARGLSNMRAVASVIWHDAVVPFLPDAVYDRVAGSTRLFLDTRFIDATMAAVHANTRPPMLRTVVGAKRTLLQRLAHNYLSERMDTWVVWGANSGIVYRYPLTDVRLIAFMLALPEEIIVYQGTQRALARKLAVEHLPGVRLAKHDTANEVHRRALRVAVWTEMAAEITSDSWTAPSRWLNRHVLHKSVAAVPDRVEGLNSVLHFAHLLAAVRIVALESHLKVSSTNHD